jgi:hypothetical protein
MSRSFGLTLFRRFLRGAPVISLLVAMPALAAGKQAMLSQEQAARKACLNGDYAKGTSILSDLFVESGGNRVFIFNQARCFEQNRRYEDAVARFEEFLRTAEASKAGLSSDDKAAAEKHIADCRKHIEQDGNKTPSVAAQEPLTPAPAIPPPTASASQAQTATSTPEIAQPAPTSRSSNSGAGLRTAGIITASVGGAGLIVGIFLNLHANSMASEMENNVGGYTPSKNSSHDTYVKATWVSYGVGAACIATGAVLFGIGLGSSRDASSGVAIVPAFDSHLAGLALAGRFQ